MPRLRPARRRSSPATRARCRRLAIEPLEERRLLAIDVWSTAVTAGTWSTAADWSLGHAPYAGDTATVKALLGAPVSITLALASPQPGAPAAPPSVAGLNVTGGSVTIDMAGLNFSCSTVVVDNNSTLTLRNSAAAAPTFTCNTEFDIATIPGGSVRVFLSGTSPATLALGPGAGLVVGKAGTGALTVQGNWTVGLGNNGTVTVGSQAGSQGTLAVTGGATVTGQPGSSLVVGQNGVGTLNVSNLAAGNTPTVGSASFGAGSGKGIVML